ncbi:hypothetical protein HK405_000341 [Cladochytrium tenue]|nr:hypothetical protein HK405_000341 [Cladochytrium tenue]
MDNFTSASTSAIPEIDVGFSQDCYNLRTIFLNHKELAEELRAGMSKILQVQGRDYLLEKCNTNALRNLVRSILTIGSGLSSGKELRDVFSVVIEKVVDPVQAFGWSWENAGLALNAVMAAFDAGLPSVNTGLRKRYAATFRRLVTAISLFCQRLLKQ